MKSFAPFIYHYLRPLSIVFGSFIFLSVACGKVETPAMVGQLHTDQAFDLEEMQSIQPMINPTGEELVLVFEDDFEGDQLDWNVWKSREYGETGIKNDTLRGPDNIEVRDGNLLLHVRKEEREHRGKTSKWTAGYVYMQEPLEINSYLEARFKSGNASGVNNAFWLAWADLTDISEVRNKYEIDIVECRRYGSEDNLGRANIAWHDWKGYRYIKTEDGKHSHIAQGMNFPHVWDEYHVWGLWFGENEIIYTFDGKEVWRGKTHYKYVDQWWTGVGKLDKWFSDYEKEAYGRHGQDDWVYRAGYNGDLVKVIFSNLPWGSSWTPLTDEADGDVMSIDYLRIYRPLRVLNREPLEVISFQDQNRVKIDGESASVPNDRLFLAPSTKVKFDLEVPVAIEGDKPHYFSLVVRKDSATDLSINFFNPMGSTSLATRIDIDNDMAVGFRDKSVEWEHKGDVFKKMASTKTAFPAIEQEVPFFSDEEDILLVIRVTPGESNGRDAVSMTAFMLPLVEEPKEPYFYANIDSKGNTSMTNGWSINQKLRSKAYLSSVSVTNGGPGDLILGAFRSGSSFRSVLPEIVQQSLTN
ncbi:hypothetical protein [Rubellicoccus peritrichatus]|uniref:GH16 domain-containing protein n=1 Tax=Rubellicoccus peritrichatus TaxID=3080537 RepID=A0AAQ3LH58_9BACT|nr:hypothetical protein [Puniceicoccus sp. CR14]WOO43708.1 hypothetical protein RZN69_11470 [Puniceicoccus sp. CR14]